MLISLLQNDLTLSESLGLGLEVKRLGLRSSPTTLGIGPGHGKFFEVLVLVFWKSRPSISQTSTAFKVKNFGGKSRVP